MKIYIKYFAAMRESCGKSEEVVETQAETPEQLLSEITQRYPMNLDKGLLKVAINECYAGFDALLSEGDTVVFIPPVAGG